MFDNATTTKKRGDIGEARAIYEYTKLGYGVSEPLFDSMKYDLIIDIDNRLYKVQVKTTSHKEGESYKAKLQVSGSNGAKVRNREDTDYDILFVLTEEGTCYSIPTNEFTATTALILGKKYDQFIIP